MRRRDFLTHRLLPLLLVALGGCASAELVKGDLLRVERRRLAPAGEGYRLAAAGPGELVLRQVRMCPLQEKRVWQEVEVRRAPAALEGAQGVGCSVIRLGEISGAIFGQKVQRSNCGGASFIDRRPTGEVIEGRWRTVRRAPCGVVRPASGRVRLTFLRARRSRTYALGPGGEVRLSRDDLAELRLYFTVLKGIEVEARHRGQTWRQKIDLE